ncbi:MAG: hypothetical protein ACE5IO_09200, partial [Thermoplasmata archaeon]
IASIERPVLALRLLLFLQKGNKDNLASIAMQGWNRRTVEASLKRLSELELVDYETRSSFPRFEKKYFLTGAGERIAVFVRHMEKELESCLECSIEDLSAFPKGCLSIVVHVLRSGWIGVTRMIEEISISPAQTYRCLDFLEDREILHKKEEQRRGRKISSYRLILLCGLRANIDLN